MAPQSDAMISAGNADSAAMTADFKGLASDSRAVKPGYLFAALPGTRVDGAGFIADAVKRGATAVLGLPSAEAAAKSAGVRFIGSDNPRLTLAKFAAAFYGAQPETVAAVTGTNGKTSVAVFLREIWTHLGRPAASLGTIGVVSPKGEIALQHTTPDAIRIHEVLAQLQKDGVEHLALEASSHGLDQYRLDGVAIAAAAFTNITRDHMDYHPRFEDYLGAKLRLFDMVRDGGVAIVNVDADHSDAFVAAAKARNLKLMTVGEKGEALKLVAREATADSQTLSIAHGGNIYRVKLPLAGVFQASNALVAAALAIGLGEDSAKVFAALEKLKGAAGRLEKVAYAASGAPIYVDYAHTPDALQTVLEALRPHTTGKLVVVFGCGGDRDRGKRPLMGVISVKYADRSIVTDDNPRSEVAEDIREEILAAAPGAEEIADRAAAIRAGIEGLKAGDLLVIAGKGHETGQIFGSVTHPFSDREEAVKSAIAFGGKAA